MFEFEYAVTEEDYILFNQHYLMYTPMGRKSKKSICVLTPLISVLLVLCFAVAGVDPKLLIAEAAVLTAGSVIWVLNINRISRRITMRTVTKMKKKGRLPYSEKGKLVFSEEEICDKTDISEHKIRYSAVERVVSTKNALYFFHNVQQATLLPVRCIGDEKTKKAFMAFVQEKIKPVEMAEQ